MGRIIIVFALVVLQIYALVDLIRSDRDEVRVLPKWLWFFVWLVPVAGPAAWLTVGRPRVGRAPGGGGSGGGGGIVGPPRPPRGPIAPDDDPEFLKRLDEQSWAARMERLRKERETGELPPDHDSDSDSSEAGSGPSGDQPGGRL